MSNTVHPDTLRAIARWIPRKHPQPSLEIWKRCGGISHQQVKNALRILLDRGRLIRAEETFRGSNNNHQKRYTFRKAPN